MPRTREFDPAEALEHAMSVFWRKGYGATSMDDLVSETGVNRYGLYDVFGSKHGLFVAALQHYRRTVITQAIAELEAPGAGLAAIRTVFRRIASRARSGEGKYGCLLCNTADEVAPFDSAAAREVAAYQRRITRAFRGAVEAARGRGEVPKDIDSKETGQYLAGLIQGASHLARSPASAADVEAFLRVGLRVLG